MSTDNLIAQRREAHAKFAAFWANLQFDHILERCDSPIERLLMAETLTRGPTELDRSTHNEAYDLCKTRTEPGAFCRLAPIYLQFEDNVRVFCASQFPLCRGDGSRIRLDFAFIAIWQDIIEGAAPAWFAVECDGHDYHERTKAQAAADRSRDRWLTEHDWTVVRFTGSELYANASGCVDELFRIIEATRPKNGSEPE